jgi:hypothetical protein
LTNNNRKKPILLAGLVVVSLSLILLSGYFFSQSYVQERQQYPYMATAQIINNTVNLNFSYNDKDNDSLIIITNQTSFIDQDANFFTKEGNAAHYDFRYNEAIS